MRKLAEVEEARKVFTEAVDWSVMRWLREKKRVRKLADQANDALDALEKEVKAQWTAPMKAAYEAVKRAENNGTEPITGHDPHLLSTVKKIKEADDISYKAHWDAEDTFAEADRKLSTTLAREGCKKAIDSWDLHETAIKKAENVVVARAGK
jgi:IS30 family transposase